MMIPDLKTACPDCKGTGQKPGLMAGGIPQINVDGRCPNCRGRGFLLTEMGKDLWKLFEPFVEEAVETRLKGEPKPAQTKPGRKP